MYFSQRQEQDLARALFLVLCAAAVLLIGCSDDCKKCPLCVEPESCSNELYDGRLYVTMLFVSMGVFVIDTKTEELIDSIIYPSSGMIVDVTADGRYLAVSDDQATVRLYDAATMTEIGALNMVGGCWFVNHDQYIMCERLQTRFYSVPDLELVYQDTIEQGFSMHYSEKRNSIFTTLDYSLLYEYNLDSFEIVRRWYPHDKDGNPYWLVEFDMSADDSLLYMLVDSPRGVGYITYDLMGDSLIAEQRMYGYFGYVCANPASGDVYVDDPGIPNTFFTPGTIYIFDGQTGDYINGISLYGYLEGDSWNALTGRHMVVSPDGRQLYVGTGHEARESGTVLRIDTRSGRVKKMLFPEFGRWPYRLAIGPKP